MDPWRADPVRENQEFPADVEVPPYDDVSWTFGLIYGVDVIAIDDAAVLEHGSEAYDQSGQFLPAAELPLAGNVWVIPNYGQRELGPIRFALGDVPVLVAEAEFEAEGDSYPAGTLILDLDEMDREEVVKVLGASSLEVVSLQRMPIVASHELDLPRLGVYQSWTSTRSGRHCHIPIPPRPRVTAIFSARKTLPAVWVSMVWRRSMTLFAVAVRSLPWVRPACW